MNFRENTQSLGTSGIYSQLNNLNLYNKTRHSYMYMFPIAGHTAGPIGLKFFVDT